MIVVKHISDGRQTVIECEAFRRCLANNKSDFEIQLGGVWSKVQLAETDVVFVENSTGRTIDAIRPGKK